MAHVTYDCVELEYSVESRKEIIPLRVEANYVSDGWLGLRCAGKLHFDFSYPENFNSKMDELIAELRKKLIGKKKQGLCL